MKKEGLNPYQAHVKRIAFIEKAVGEGVLDRISVSKRNQDIAFVYNLNEGITGKKVGEIFAQPSGKPLIKQRIAQIKEVFLRKAWEAASLQLQNDYHLEELLMRKPMPLGEITSQIKSAVENGIKPQDIGLSDSSIKNARKTLRKRGIDVPSLSSYANLKTRIEAESDDRKLQEILDSYHPARLIRSLRKNSKIDTFTTVSKAVRKSGFYFAPPQTRLFAERIKKEKIPIRPVPHINRQGTLFGTYWVIYSQDAPRIAEVLNNDPDFQGFKENPVRLVSGTFDGPLPATTTLARKKGYQPVGTLLKEMSIQTIGTGRRLLIEGCPCPIFEWGNRLFFRLAQKADIQPIIAKRYKELQAA